MNSPSDHFFAGTRFAGYQYAHVSRCDAPNGAENRDHRDRSKDDSWRCGDVFVSRPDDFLVAEAWLGRINT